MSLYFTLIDGQRFEERIAPALAASWRLRSFTPCRSLCADLLPAALEFRDRYSGEEPLLARFADLTFDRATWRLLVGEVLMYAADDMPLLQTTLDTLLCLLEPARYRHTCRRRENFTPIEQAHQGTCDLRFGAAFYHPDQAGCNDRADVARLCDALDAIVPARWTLADLADLADLHVDDRADELAFAQEWFPALQSLYRQARDKGQVIVCETIGE